MEQRYFAGAHKNGDIRKKSSSGGAFTAITDYWFSEYGIKAVVYGCAMDDQLRVRHLRADHPEQRDMMRGSKYIGSDLSGIFRMVLEDLNRGNYVAFSGTPCQISGLKTYLDVKKMQYEDHLLTIEVICHGVGSVRFFEDYIRHLEEKYKSKAVSCTFRAKSRPGKKQDMQVRFANGKLYQASSTRFDWFYSLYTKNLILRPSCFSCPYARPERIADISIADQWGEEHVHLEGRSLMIASSELGRAWLSKAMEQMQWEEISAEQVHQPHMHSPCKQPPEYPWFWEQYEKEGYLKVQKLQGNNTLLGRFRVAAVDILYGLHIIETVKKIKILLRS